MTRERSERKIWLSFDVFIERLANKCYIELDVIPPTTFLPSIAVLTAFNGKATPNQIHSYQQKIGNINYVAVNTRPDIARASSKLSEFLRNPSLDHMNAVNYLLRYFVGTRFLAIEYNGLDLYSLRTFIVSSDASFADTPERKSF